MIELTWNRFEMRKSYATESLIQHKNMNYHYKSMYLKVIYEKLFRNVFLFRGDWCRYWLVYGGYRDFFKIMGAGKAMHKI